MGKFDPNKLAKFKQARPSPRGGDPMTVNPSSGSPYLPAPRPDLQPQADTFMEGLTTNDPTQGFFASVGREALPSAAAMVARGMAAPGIVTAVPAAAAGGALGETVRQGLVGAMGGEMDPHQIGKQAAYQAGGEVFGKAASGAASMAGDFGVRWARRLGIVDVPDRAVEMFKDAGFKKQGKALASAGKPVDVFPEAVDNLRGSINEWGVKVGEAYGKVVNHMEGVFGKRVVLNRQGLKKEFQEILKNSRFDPRSETDRAALREIGRLIKDALSPFSGTVKGAVNMSKRFSDNMVFGKDTPIRIPKGEFNRVIGQLKGAWHKRMDALDPRWSRVNRAVSRMKQLQDDTSSFLNAKDLPQAVERATVRGNTDFAAMNKIRAELPSVAKDLDAVEAAALGSHFRKTSNNVLGQTMRFGLPAARAAGAVAPRAAAAGVSELDQKQMFSPYDQFRR